MKTNITFTPNYYLRLPPIVPATAPLELTSCSTTDAFAGSDRRSNLAKKGDEQNSVSTEYRTGIRSNAASHKGLIAAIQANSNKIGAPNAADFKKSPSLPEPDWKRLFLSQRAEIQALRKGIDDKHKEMCAALETDQGKAYARIKELEQYIEDLKEEHRIEEELGE